MVMSSVMSESPFLDFLQDVVLAHGKHVVEHTHGDDVVMAIEGAAANAYQAIALHLHV